MSVSRFAVVQFAPELEPTVNLERIRTFVAEAAKQQATLVLLPEYSSTFNARLDGEVLTRAQPIDGEFVSTMREIARTFHTTLVFGFVEATDVPDKFANTILAIGSDGETLTSYRKAHLYDAFGQKESDRVVAGALDTPPVFEHDGFTIGIQTCYDLRFPEQSRWLVDVGADVLLVPAEWVAGEHKVKHWRTLLAARAIENTVYVAAADHPEPIGVGHSSVFDPLGNELLVIESGEGIAYADLDTAKIVDVRETNPSIFLRRFHVSVNEL